MFPGTTSRNPSSVITVNENCTVHWIHRKALRKGDLRNHKGRAQPV
jgi:hypothetical protein